MSHCEEFITITVSFKKNKRLAADEQTAQLHGLKKKSVISKLMLIFHQAEWKRLCLYNVNVPGIFQSVSCIMISLLPSIT